MRRNNILNRNFPVFFISKYVLVLSRLFLAVSCKSKTDWRDNYKKSKVEKSTTTSKKKVVNTPANLTEISKLLNVNESQLKNKSLYHFIVDWYGTPYKFEATTKTESIVLVLPTSCLMKFTIYSYPEFLGI